MRQLLNDLVIIFAPILVAVLLWCFSRSLTQMLKSMKEESLTTVPRLAVVTAIIVCGMPWFMELMAAHTRVIVLDLYRFLK